MYRVYKATKNTFYKGILVPEGAVCYEQKKENKTFFCYCKHIAKGNTQDVFIYYKGKFIHAICTNKSINMLLREKFEIKQRKGNKKINYIQLMQSHNRKKKKKSGGLVDNKRAITDFECSKNPLHDFRRVNSYI